MSLPESLAREYPDYDLKPVFAAYILPMTIYHRTYPSNWNQDDFINCKPELLTITQNTTFTSLLFHTREQIQTKLEINDAEFEFDVRLRPNFQTTEKIIFSDDNWDEWKWKILGRDVPEGLVDVSFHLVPPPVEEIPVVDDVPKKERSWSFWSFTEMFSEKQGQGVTEPTSLPPTSSQRDQTLKPERKDSWADTIIIGLAELAPFTAHLDPQIDMLILQYQRGDAFEDVQRSMRANQRRLKHQRRIEEKRKIKKQLEEQEHERQSLDAACSLGMVRRQSSIFA